MIKEVQYSLNFNTICTSVKRPVVVIGEKKYFEKISCEVSNIDMFCDISIKTEEKFNGNVLCRMKDLENIMGSFYVILAERNETNRKKIFIFLNRLEVDVFVFNYFNNVAFGYSFWDTDKSYISQTKFQRLKVNIVCRDEGWIFRKFAEKMEECLEARSVKVSISPDTRRDVDINHHIPYAAYAPYENDTLMITHVDNSKKIEIIKKQLQVARLGICMSKETMNMLAICGVPREKLCYINPAQDGVIKPHKYLIGLTNKCHKEDLRKRDSALIDIVDGINPEYFAFAIMGGGWEKIVAHLRKNNFEVEYFPDFEYSKYVLLMQKLDYFMFMGFDEGAMGYLDALAAGVGTIVTPQGYHLDTDCKIDYPCSTIKDFHNAFLELQRKKEARRDSVINWTWGNYAQKHLEVWNYITGRENLNKIYGNQLYYQDGIFSVIIEDNRI